jgi:DNA helicase-2/ATP-dependent DNA helicase PcrA
VRSARPCPKLPTPTSSGPSTASPQLLHVDRWDLDDPSITRASAPLGASPRCWRTSRPSPAGPGASRTPTAGRPCAAGSHGGEKYLKKFADYLSFYAQSDYEDFTGEPDFDLDAVTVTTVHAAKGLEWPVVFVPCLTGAALPVVEDGQAQDWMMPRTSSPRAATRAPTPTSDGSSTSP